MECPTCGKTLPTEGGSRQHHTKVHGDPLPNRTCTGCGVEFYRRSRPSASGLDPEDEGRMPG